MLPMVPKEKKKFKFFLKETTVTPQNTISKSSNHNRLSSFNAVLYCVAFYGT
jgi:hypothetical protein